MPINPSDKKILNDFSKSQPGLQRFGLPTEDKDLPLGDIIDSKEDVGVAAQPQSTKETGNA